MESCDLLQTRSEVGARGLKSSFKGARWQILTFEGPHIGACNFISALQHLHYIQNNKRAQRHFLTWSLNIFSHDTIDYLLKLNIDTSYEQDLLSFFAVLTMEKWKWKPFFSFVKDQNNYLVVLLTSCPPHSELLKPICSYRSLILPNV